ncbi:MAG: hypothetical protein FWD36_04425 [Treponema sp.]|nr:hypothetical protein [Treponema sp.]
MNKAWNQFTKIRKRYRTEIEKLIRQAPELQGLQQRLVDSRSASYTVETPIVYNCALDDVQADSEIRMILVGDNPGRREQAAENRRYLVGPSGKIAEKFFRENPSLNIDFRKNVIILNKTPIHTPRTIELKELCRLGGPALEKILVQSQQFMARLLLEFQQALDVPVWITGYSEMKKGGVFEAYTNELKTIYDSTALQESVFLYRHFSMNQFTIDLKQQAAPGESLAKTLNRIGTAYRARFL